jgi:hypothetical protein
VTGYLPVTSVEITRKTGGKVFQVKKILTAIICALVLAAFPIMAFAAPSAEVGLTVTDAVNDSDDIIITVDIAISEPSNPFASLDFNLISSDYNSLSIVDLGDTEAVNLDISFTQEYGHMVHNGRADEATGGYRYLIGIYSQSGGNLINEATDICSVRLRYSGDEVQTLSVSDLKLVYIDSSGEVTSAKINTESVSLSIDNNIVAEFDETEVPFSQSVVFGEPEDDRPVVLWVIIAVLATAVVALSAAVAVITRKKKRV